MTNVTDLGTYTIGASAGPDAPVLIRWRDALRYEESPPSRCYIIRETVGYIVSEDADGIILAMDRDEDGNYEKGFGVPTAYIVERASLEPSSLNLRQGQSESPV